MKKKTLLLIGLLVIILLGIGVYLFIDKKKEKIITIKFNSNGGTVIEDIKVVCGNEPENLPVPKREGYTFRGWFFDKIPYMPYSKNNDCQDISVFAGWKEEAKCDENGCSYSGGQDFKPVLYLYPKEKQEIKVTFGKPELLTTTYPKFNKEWQVVAYPNGNLYDENGRYYYGLYWEEMYPYNVDFSEGFYVEKDDAIPFLEEKLAMIGLNERESNEFIMYWLPIMEKNEKNLVYFELTEERDSHNHLMISPKPDSLLRITMHLKKISEKVNIKEQKLKGFKRIGFSAVEWGGKIY